MTKTSNQSQVLSAVYIAEMISGKTLDQLVDADQSQAIKRVSAVNDNLGLLPIKYNGTGDKENPKQILKSLGITVLKRANTLFNQVKLPDGWTMPDAEGYWAKLLDDKGRTRASIFYKSAFWDEDAFWYASPRFTYVRTYSDKGVTPKWMSVDLVDHKTGAVLFSSGKLSDSGWDADAKFKQECAQTLKGDYENLFDIENWNKA